MTNSSLVNPTAEEEEGRHSTSENDKSLLGVHSQTHHFSRLEMEKGSSSLNAPKSPPEQVCETKRSLNDSLIKYKIMNKSPKLGEFLLQEPLPGTSLVFWGLLTLYYFHCRNHFPCRLLG
ncbi:hypothetical protein XENOCAPTIV_006399 [Xenoophorus captivus]|uniref:Uncharacterized protein n=1 Tax=Xenoophorus captivus TaxID=1517983 RepID=A0ABV0Q3M1_9TELE